MARTGTADVLSRARALVTGSVIVDTRACRQTGVTRVEALYYSFGEDDGMVIVEAPGETTVTAFVLAAMSPGHLRASKTTVLMRPAAVVDAMKKAGGVSYKGPKK
jgi:hypothetical protein